jgi:hypothetical protein
MATINRFQIAARCKAARSWALAQADRLDLPRLNSGRGWDEYLADPFAREQPTVTIHYGGSPHVVIRDDSRHVVRIRRF